VKDGYIHHESAGDQFVGQTVTGLSCLSIEFACLPCYFDLTDTLSCLLTEFACLPCYFDFNDTEDEGGMHQELDDFLFVLILLVVGR